MTGNIIYTSDPGLWYIKHREEIMTTIAEVIDSGQYILGEKLKMLEERFAAHTNCQGCAGVASGTEAIVLALKAMDIRPGDEVITVSHTAVATVAAIEQAGAVPVLADIDPVSRCIDPEGLEGLYTKKVKAIVPVHIYGYPADMEKIMDFATEKGLKVLEDCAQANGAAIHGKPVGSFGHAAAFSFYPTKNIGALGDGGAVTSTNPGYIEQVKSLREYGFKKSRHISNHPGINSRLDEIQAAVLLVRLRHFEEDMGRRCELAAKYRARLGNIGGIRLPAVPDGITHAFHLFVIECVRRDDLASYLKEHGIMTARHYPAPVHLQPAYRGRLRGSDRLPNTEKFYDQLLTLPFYPEMTDSQAEYICDMLSAWKL